MTVLDDFRTLYEQTSEAVCELRRTNEALANRHDIVAEEVAVCRGLLLDVQAEIAAQVTAAEAETARLQAALRRVESMLDRVSARLVAAVTPLPVPPGGVPLV